MAFVDIFQLFSTSLGSACVIGVVTLLFFRIKGVRQMAGKNDIWYKLLLVVIYGLLSIYGTQSAVAVGDAMCNVRDLAPMFAGLAGGPIAGVGAGLIGGLFRFFMGGSTMWPCAIANLLAGIVGGVIWLILKKKTVKPVWGLVIGAAVEAVHMLLLVIFGSAELAAVIATPMIIVNAAGLWLCLYVHTEVNGYK